MLLFLNIGEKTHFWLRKSFIKETHRTKQETILRKKPAMIVYARLIPKNDQRSILYCDINVQLLDNLPLTFDRGGRQLSLTRNMDI